MSGKHGFSENNLASTFRRVRFDPAIVQAMTPPADSPSRSWQDYRALFVNPKRIQAGAQFRARHMATLKRAASQFGVPEEIIVAIIGIETIYGRNLGSHRVIDALTTLAFDYPPRAEFFRSELEHFLLFTREAGVNVFKVKGSYAGAIGIPQFMPGSYRRYALDYDGDGRINLSNNPADAIGSVGNFLEQHGWERGQPVAFPVSVSGDAWRKLLEGGSRPARRIADLNAFGVAVAATLPPETLCALIELETPGKEPEYRLGLKNFYVITRYNRSTFYASAVLDLAEAIATSTLTANGGKP